MFGGNIRKKNCEQNRRVTRSWMEEKFDDKIKNWWPLKNDNLIIKMQDDERVDNQERLKSVNTMPSHLGSLVFGHKKRFVNIVIREIGFFTTTTFTTLTPILLICIKTLVCAG